MEVCIPEDKTKKKSVLGSPTDRKFLAQTQKIK